MWRRRNQLALPNDNRPTLTASEYLLACNRQLTPILDEILRILDPQESLHIMAEILGVYAHPQQLFTFALRPDTSVAIYTRVRANEGIIGHVFVKNEPWIGAVRRSDSDASGFGSPDDATHLLRTESVLVVPLVHQGQVIGVLNLESPHAHVFSRESLALLQQRGIFTQLVDVLHTSGAILAQQGDIVAELLQKTEELIFTTINPDDIESTYHEMVRVAAQLVDETNIIGCLFLVSEQVQAASFPSSDTASTYLTVVSQLWGYQPARAEWDLHGKTPTLARRAVKSGMVEMIPDMRVVRAQYPSFPVAGSGFENGSEIGLPLVLAGKVIGVLDLASARPDAFTPQDKERLQRFIPYIIQAISRAKEIAEKRTAAEQLKTTQKFLHRISDLHEHHLRVEKILDLRNEILSEVLDIACQETGSRYGLVVERRETTMTIAATHGEIIPDAPQRWNRDEGIIGEALNSGEPRLIPSVRAMKDPDQYIPIFPDVLSELAVPVTRGDKRLGALDLESPEEYHYTQIHLQWAQVLADIITEVLAAAELALNNYRNHILGDVAQEVGIRVARLQEMKLPELSPYRRETLHYLLEQVYKLIGVERAAVLLSVNAYRRTETTRDNDEDDVQLVLDETYGRLVQIVTIPAQSDAPRISKIDKGNLGRVFTEQRPVVFNDPTDQSAAGDAQGWQSGMFVPLFEGPTVVGVLALESSHLLRFMPPNQGIALEIARLASDVVVAAKLRTQEIQTLVLRDYDLSLISNSATDVPAFVRTALTDAWKLTGIEKGWAQMIVLRTFRGDTEPRVEQEYTLDCMGQEPVFMPRAMTGYFESDYPPVRYAAYRGILESGDSWLTLDLDDSDQASADERTDLPWGDTQTRPRSFIAVPLLLPNKEDKPKEDKPGEVFAILSVASPDPLDFSDIDDQILRLFSQTVQLGLRNLQFVGARESLTVELTHDFSKSLFPLRTLAKESVKTLDATESLTPHQFAEVRSLHHKILDLAQLTIELMYWYVDLADETEYVQDEVPEPISAETIVDELRDRFATFAHLLTGRQVRWTVTPTTPPLPTSETRQKLMNAALFKLIENALKYGPTADVTVTIAPTPARDAVTFTIVNIGEQVPPADRPFIFDLRFRSSSAQIHLGSGVGLHQVKRIAQVLGGSISYEAPPDTQENIFTLRLPAFAITA